MRTRTMSIALVVGFVLFVTSIVTGVMTGRRLDATRRQRDAARSETARLRDQAAQVNAQIAQAQAEAAQPREELGSLQSALESSRIYVAVDKIYDAPCLARQGLAVGDQGQLVPSAAPGQVTPARDPAAPAPPGTFGSQGDPLAISRAYDPLKWGGCVRELHPTADQCRTVNAAPVVVAFVSALSDRVMFREQAVREACRTS